MSDSGRTRFVNLPPTYMIQDPQTRAFCEALTQAWQLRNGDIGADDSQRFITKAEWDQYAANPRLQALANDRTLYPESVSSGGTTSTGDTGGIPGQPGAQTAIVYLYQWSSAQPGDPSGTSTYTWATGAHSGYTGGNSWSTSAPSNPGTPGVKLWVATKTITAVTGASTTEVAWAAGTFTVAAWSANGLDGAAGLPGTQTAQPTVYKWDLTIPAGPSGTSTYTWATSSFGSAPTGWSLTPGTAPSVGYTLWAATVTLTDTASNATTSINWTNAIITARGYAGTNGTAGDSVDMVFKRSATQPATPSPSTGTPAGWYTDVASVPAGSDPIWSSVGYKTGGGFTYTWDTPVQLQGTNGANGLSIVELTIYIRSASVPGRPTGGSYDFGTKTLTPPFGWSSSVPSGTNPCYASRAVAYVQGTTGTFTNFTWSTPSVSFQNGADGTAGASSRMCYSRIAGNPTPVSGTIDVTGDSVPSQSQSSSTWGLNVAWTTTDPNPSSTDTLYQADGIYNPATGKTVWSTPYISSLKVGTLSAVTANTGALNVTGELTIKTGGSIKTGNIARSGNSVAWGTSGFYVDTTGLFAAGNYSQNVLIDPSSGVYLNGDVVGTPNLQTNAATEAKSSFGSGSDIYIAGGTDDSGSTGSSTTVYGVVTGLVSAPAVDYSSGTVSINVILYSQSWNGSSWGGWGYVASYPFVLLAPVIGVTSFGEGATSGVVYGPTAFVVPISKTISQAGKIRYKLVATEAWGRCTQADTSIVQIATKK